MTISQTVAELWFYNCLDFGPPTTTLSLSSAKFGWNRSSTGNFNNMQILIFCEFGFKIHVHAPVSAGLRISPPSLTGAASLLARNFRKHVMWYTDRQNRSFGVKNGKKERKKLKHVTSHVFAESTSVFEVWSATRICMWLYLRVWDAVIHSKYHRNPLRGFGATRVEIWQFTFFCYWLFQLPILPYKM